jgi:hypothetical protein
MLRRSLGLTLTLLASVGACSVLNSPEELKPADEGSGGSGGSAGTSSSGGTGLTGDGGNGVPLGGDTGSGGCGDDCVPGGAPPVGKDCTDSAADCRSTAPICDAVNGECRACVTNEECTTDLGKDFCVTSGAAKGLCANCLKDTDCSGRTPICGNAGECRACNADDECESGACNPNGACAAEADIVYALAETGISGTECGTKNAPCRFLATATTKLSATRRTLVLVKTPKAFKLDNAIFPAVAGLRVVGNGVSITPSTGSAFSVPAGSEVAFDNVVITGVTDNEEGGIRCEGASVAITNSTLQDNTNGLLATNCNVAVTQSLLKHNSVPWNSSNAAINLHCADGCTKTATVLRNRFEDNAVAFSAWDMSQVTIENNLFLRNGADGYVRVISLYSPTRFAYNTLVENFNTCTDVGIVACVSQCANVANISYNNFPGEDCQNQVWYGGTLSYNLTEVAYPGVMNKIGDPKFVDAANGNYTPGPGSPALDSGNPDDAPPLDFLGTKRPVGAAPDIGAIEAKAVVDP